MNRVVHFEIHAEEPERAVDFYSKVFGWAIKKWEGVDIDYWVIDTGLRTTPGINGGLFKRKGPAPKDGQAVNAYVCTMDVANADDMVKKVEAAGGSVAVPKKALFGLGWLVYCKDTEGNIFGMMQNDPQAK